MTILVTGGTGFIGSATVERLLAKGERVVVLDDLYRGHRAAVDNNVPLYQGRVGDLALVARIASEHRIEACVHFAALTYVGESVQDPQRYFENNLEQGIAFVGALLQDFLLPFLTNSLTDDYRKFIESRETPLVMLSKFEETQFGWDHALAGACLAHG